MVSLHPQFVADDGEGPRAVIIPMSDWRQIVEELDELEDICAYDEAQSGSSKAISFDQAVREIKGDGHK